jgi:hypothetical protein
VLDAVGCDVERLRASAKIDRYAHRVTAGKVGLAARWLTIEVTVIARRDSVDA